ncbi:MAG: AmmeMemoRadiSam system protein A [Myxococcota bacterium]
MSALSPADEMRLLAIAHDSLAHGLRHGRALVVEPAAESEALRAHGASFVSLHRADATLRGCIGSLEAIRPIARDVAENAFGAAFRDPRFAPVASEEVEELHLSISVLGPYEPLAVDSPDVLARELRPGRDGLVLQQGARRATFLPAVWQSLADPLAFVHALEHKAGITSWRTPVEVWRYETLTIEGPRAE